MAEINVDELEIEKLMKAIGDEVWPEFLARVKDLGQARNTKDLAHDLYVILAELYPELDLLTPEANAATEEFNFGG